VTRRRREFTPAALEEEAREAELAPGRGTPPLDTSALDGVRLHRDIVAAEVTAAVGARAVTMGPNVYFAPGTPTPASPAGRRLLAHELTHVAQQRSLGTSMQRFQASERPQIAKDLAAMMAVVEAIVRASSSGEDVLMANLVRNSGGRDVGAAMPKPLRSDRPNASMLTLRYLMTSRAGLIDMRHFMQLLYISWFFNSGQAGMANRAATKKGIEHEETAEAASKYGPEDLTSNALGAWTATRLAGFPQAGDLIARIRETLTLCGPVDFDALSPASQKTLVDFYAAQTGAGEPANQNRTAVALIPVIPELAGKDRSFPFELDEDDPNRATISGATFGVGAAGLTSDTDIRNFVFTQRDVVVTDLTPAVRGRLAGRLLEGWVSDEDLNALERLFRLGDAAGKDAVRKAAAGGTIGNLGQRARLKLLLGSS
jgi:hypothetical protein